MRGDMILRYSHMILGSNSRSSLITWLSHDLWVVYLEVVGVAIGSTETEDVVSLDVIVNCMGQTQTEVCIGMKERKMLMLDHTIQMTRLTEPCVDSHIIRLSWTAFFTHWEQERGSLQDCCKWREIRNVESCVKSWSHVWGSLVIESGMFWRLSSEFVYIVDHMRFDLFYRHCCRENCDSFSDNFFSPAVNLTPEFSPSSLWLHCYFSVLPDQHCLQF